MTTKKTWSVYATVSAGKYLGEFEAETGEDAVALAAESDGMGVHVCHHCAKHLSDPQVSRLTAEHQTDSGEFETYEEEV